MNLQKKFRLGIAFRQGVFHPDHSQLDDIRRRALNGRVQGDSLRAAADVVIAAGKLWNIPAAAVQGCGVAVTLGVFHHLLHIVPDAVIIGKIIVNIGSGLVPTYPDVLRKRELTDAVDNAEVYRFGVSALQGSHFLHRHAEDLGGSGGMNVHMVAEGLLHSLVVCDMRQHPQLNLAVIRVHQHTAFFRHEHFPNFRPQVGADGDVLQIRLRRGQPPGGSDQILEGGVHPPVGADFFQQAVGIGGFQLSQHPVVHDGRDDGMLVFQLFQHLRVGGIALAGLFHGGQTQLFKKHVSQLLGRIDVEFPLGIGENQNLAVGNPPGEHIPEGFQLGPVDENAPALHIVEHPAQGQLDFLIEPIHAGFFQFRSQKRPQMPQSLGTGGHILILHGFP